MQSAVRAVLGAAGSAAEADHISPGLLQSIFSKLPLCGKRMAGRAGSLHILQEGTTPVVWLNRFGRSLNRGANSDADVPLQLPGPQPFTWRCDHCSWPEGAEPVLQVSRVMQIAPHSLS